MFGFSLQKLLLLAAIVAAVWYGFKLVSRLKEARELEARKGGGRPKPARRGRKAASEGETETMVQCPVCKTYVAARGAGSCGRDDCPY
jgi:uncharacterized protein